jgi:hypothetical protein
MANQYIEPSIKALVTLTEAILKRANYINGFMTGNDVDQDALAAHTRAIAELMFAGNGAEATEEKHIHSRNQGLFTTITGELLEPMLANLNKLHELATYMSSSSGFGELRGTGGPNRMWLPPNTRSLGLYSIEHKTFENDIDPATGEPYQWIYEEDNLGTKYTYRNGLLHSRCPDPSKPEISEPAVCQARGGRFWYYDGLFHRDGSNPAYSSGCGICAWYKHGQLHRNQYAALSLSNGTHYVAIDGIILRGTDNKMQPLADLTLEWTPEVHKPRPGNWELLNIQSFVRVSPWVAPCGQVDELGRPVESGISIYTSTIEGALKVKHIIRAKVYPELAQTNPEAVPGL